MSKYRVRQGQTFMTNTNQAQPVQHHAGSEIELPDDVAALHAHRLEKIEDAPAAPAEPPPAS